MLNSLKEYIQETEQEPISESLIGKGFAIGQQRKHAANKTKLQSVASRIQSTAKKGISEDDPDKRSELLFSLFIDLASALKIASEMSANAVNVSTAGVLFAESVQKQLAKALSKNLKR